MPFRAPYRFVPLPDAVVHPESADDVSHDMPAPNGFSGVLTLTIVADTPLTVGDVRKLLTPAEREAMFERRADEQADPARETDGPTLVRTFRTPPEESGSDKIGELSVPGSTTRGAVRSVMELATFGALEQIDDGRFSYRRPGAADYNARFTSGGWSLRAGRNQYAPKYDAGFLVIDAAGWTIRPCDFARVEQTDVVGLVGAALASFQTEGASDRPGWSKHGFFRDKGGSEIRQLHVESHRAGGDWQEHRRFRKRRNEYGQEIREEERYDLSYRRARSVPAPGFVETQGRLVFTGQAGKKHMEFFFFRSATARRPLAVPDRAREEFELLQRRAVDRVHGEDTTWTWLRNEDPLSRAGGAPTGLDGIPIFYLADGGCVTHLGVAAMFPVVTKRSIHDAFPPEQLASRKADFADLIFGEVRKDDEKRHHGLKARVSFGLARPTASQDIRVDLSPIAIYSTPKASFAEAYLKSGGWNDAKVEASGAKRYAARASYEWPRFPAELHDKHKIQSVLEGVVPAREGAKVRFSLPLRVHNLTPVELGALLWTLLWGGDETKRHMIGAGKPHGQGVARFTLDHVEGEEWAEVVKEGLSRLKLTRLKLDGDAARPWARALMAAFEGTMDAKVVASGQPGGWLETPTLRALLGLASPESIRPQEREAWRYMTLAEHMQARKDGLRIPAAPRGTLKRDPS